MLITFESSGILKQDDKNIFDMDFTCKKEPLKDSSNAATDFFELSMKLDKVAPLHEEEPIKTLENTEEIAEEITEDVAEEVSEEASEDLPTECSECTEPDADETISEVEIIEKSFAEVSGKETEEPKEENDADIEEKPEIIPSGENDEVIISVVNWGKSKNKTQKPQKTALTDTPVPKKNNTVVSTEDGFEIKLCNFKSLSNKKDNPDNKIKKK